MVTKEQYYDSFMERMEEYIANAEYDVKTLLHTYGDATHIYTDPLDVKSRIESTAYICYIILRHYRDHEIHNDDNRAKYTNMVMHIFGKENRYIFDHTLELNTETPYDVTLEYISSIYAMTRFIIESVISVIEDSKYKGQSVLHSGICTVLSDMEDRFLNNNTNSPKGYEHYASTYEYTSILVPEEEGVVYYFIGCLCRILILSLTDLSLSEATQSLENILHLGESGIDGEVAVLEVTA